MTELITHAQANIAFGVALPLLGLAVIGAVFAQRRSGREATRWGVPLVVAGILWWAFNAIFDALGPDSLVGLAVNGLLFIAAGLGLGSALRARPPAPESSETTP
jgi:hypothetical protein